MKKVLIISAAVLLQQLLTACYGAGTHPYSREVKLDCPADTVIHRLSVLKAAGGFGANNYGVDGYHDENKQFYTFRLISNEHNFCLQLDVIAHTSKQTGILLNGIDDYSQGGRWQAFDRDLTDSKKQEVITWFKQKVATTIQCNSSY
ncbi:hypothetical protein [Hymenobacter psoromatis]|uniref:hypothetical protein n=1 Tax=Hymenobacter psoromatis TaxID=1484116 RepID=UPI001CC1BCFF|nr:hypothetical protein [Hymenobacter psoromatis]